MANTRKSKSQQVTRKNVDFYDAELQMAGEIMRHRNRGNNLSRLLRDLIHEERDRSVQKFNAATPTIPAKQATLTNENTTGRNGSD